VEGQIEECCFGQVIPSRPLLPLVPRKSSLPGPRGQQHGELLFALAAPERFPRSTELRTNVYVRPPSMDNNSVMPCFSVSTPFSYSCKRSPKDAEDQLEAISGAAYAMKKSHGTVFTVSPCVLSLLTTIVHISAFQTGQLCSTLYRSVGRLSFHSAPLNVFCFC
jgi:hypothetical protein